jgi:hypothetical protein
LHVRSNDGLSFIVGYAKFLHQPHNEILCLHVPERFDVQKAREYARYSANLPL